MKKDVASEKNDNYFTWKTRLSVRQSDIARAIKGAQAAGISIAQVEIGPAGKIVITSADPEKNLVQDPYIAWKEGSRARTA
jgi:hypothetical protein